ncbi:MAG: hypothetical protein ACFFC6_16795 [Promethearchaeota archaeon]
MRISRKPCMDMWLIKTNDHGQVEWNQTIGGVQDDLANAVVSSSDGGFVITGVTQSYGMGDRDVWVIKINATGHPEWNQTFGGVNSDYADSILCSTEGEYILAGRMESFGAGESDMWVIKTTAGQPEWNLTFGGIEEEAAYSIIATSDGGYVVVGRTASYGAGSADTWLIKIMPHCESDLPTSPPEPIPGWSWFCVICVFSALLMKNRKK